MKHYDHNHHCPFEAYITNLGMYNDGELVGEWVAFPTSEGELKRVFSRIGIGEEDKFGTVYEEFFITDYDCYVPELYNYLGEYEDLETLNKLAIAIEGLDQYDYAKFCAALELEVITSLDDILKIIDELNQFELYENIKSYSDWGYHLVHELGIFGNIDDVFRNELASYIDYEQLGKDRSDGDITSFGYVVRY